MTNCEKCGEELVIVKDTGKRKGAAVEAIAESKFKVGGHYAVVTGLTGKSTERRARARHRAQCQGKRSEEDKN